MITGASRGIGRALVEVFAEAGSDLGLCARNPKPLDGDEIVRLHQVQALVAECDVRREASVVEFFTAIKLRFGRIDVLINNAGVAGRSAPIAEITADDWHDILDTNLTGAFLCTRAALPLLRSGGAIVNNLSVAAKMVFPGMAAYNAAKWGARGFTETLRQEVRERGIRVIGVYPGATDTSIWSQFWPEAPRARMMSPETIARAVLHAVTMPENATMAELVIAPTAGAL